MDGSVEKYVMERNATEREIIRCYIYRLIILIFDILKPGTGICDFTSVLL